MVHGNVAYFSRSYNVYSYAEDKWATLPASHYRSIGLAIVDNKLIAIGGYKYGLFRDNTTNSVLSLCDMEWKQRLPPMPTKRVRPAAVTTPTHLVVAGGRRKWLLGTALSVVEVLDLNTLPLQWSSATSSPEVLRFPHMTHCGDTLYLSENSTVFSCSMEELLRSCISPSTNGSSVWTMLTDIPVPCGSCIVTLKGHLLAIGGCDRMEYSTSTPTGAIHCNDRSDNSWSVVEEMLTPRFNVLVAVLPSNELIVTGGYVREEGCSLTEILY